MIHICQDGMHVWQFMLKVTVSLCIAGSWKHAKQRFKMMSGTNVANFEGHLAQVVFQNHHKENIYHHFFNYMKVVYHLEGDAQLQAPEVLYQTWTPNIVEGNEDEEEGNFTLLLDGSGDEKSSDSDSDVPKAIEIATPQPQRRRKRQKKERACYPDGFEPL